jgi:hypothetical protein
MDKLAWIGLLSAGSLIATPVWPCGACLEDKMAATYDYQVAQQAAAERRSVIFCGVEGAVDEQALSDAARKVPGLDPSSVRASAEPAALSFALDTRVTSAQTAVSTISKALRGKSTVMLLREVPPTETAKGSATTIR